MAKPTPLAGFGPSTRIRDAADHIIGVRLTEVRQFEDRLAQQIGVDDVHDMRVATRRLRAAMRLCGVNRKVDANVKRFQDALGDVRDLHVQMRWLEEQEKESEGTGGRALRHLRDELASALPTRERALQAALKRWRSRTVPLVREAMKDLDTSFRFGGSHVRRLVRKRLSRIETGMDHFTASSDAHVAHQLRIQVKKLRYLAELLEPVWPDKVQALLQALTPLQETFGDLHDVDVRIAELTGTGELVKSPVPGAVPLLKQLEGNRKKLVVKGTELVRRWQSESLARDFRRMFKERRTATA